MMAYFFIIISFFYVATSAYAQNEIRTTGNCNVTLTGSSQNNVTIHCQDQDDSNEKPENVRLVIASNNTPIVIGQVNWDFVDLSISEFKVFIDDKNIISSFMDKIFRDERLVIARGEHFYTIEVSLEYKNGNYSEASCSGIVDAQVSAQVVPRITISQDAFNGSLFPIGCGFQLR